MFDGRKDDLAITKWCKKSKRCISKIVSFANLRGQLMKVIKELNILRADKTNELQKIHLSICLNKKIICIFVALLYLKQENYGKQSIVYQGVCRQGSNRQL